MDTIDDKKYDLQSYNFTLPSSLIAKYPVEPRDEARLLVMDRLSGIIEDSIFSRLSDYLEAGDTLVINNTRVIPARLYAYKETGARIELLLLKKEGDFWQALVRPAKRVKPGHRLKFQADTEVELEVIRELDIAGGRLVKFNNCNDEESFIDIAGEIPLPPYIDRPAAENDRIQYQTVYAEESGSVAAPTAGLHFTNQLLQSLEEMGVNIARILLHVGLGTFRPVSTDDIRNHQMHYEYYHIDQETADLLNNTRKNGKNIIAVGTTVVRTLETVYNEVYGFSSQSGETNKFIYPGYQLKAIDKLITNFHLPGSSLLMLVSAFAGLTNTQEAYKHAIEKEYRFFSYGDAMLIK